VTTSHRSILAGLCAASTAALGAGLLIATLIAPADAATAPVPLGTASSFSVLAGSGITNTGPTTVFGDIGTFPTTSITGLADMTIGGANHGGDAVTQHAKGSLVIAYNTAAGALPPTAVTADLGGTTLVPGIYKASAAMGLTGAVTLNAEGDPDAVFIFQAGSTLTTASDSSVVLLNGAQACNIFWQVGSSATFGTRTAFRGNVLAHTSITATTKATFEGRLLASDGAVTLDTNTITRPGCAAKGAAGGGAGGVGGGSTPTAPATHTPGAAATSTAAAHPSHTAGAAGASAGGGGGGASGNGGHGTSATGAGSTGSGTGTADHHPRLPDTGGPHRLLLTLALAAIMMGAAITLLTQRNRYARHVR
jgi:hypothetical protein